MPAPDEEPEAPVVAVPGEIQVLDSGVPWVRTREELDHQWRRLARMLHQLHTERGLDYENLGERERALLGMARAAWWTLGQSPYGPMTHAPAPVTGKSIRRELELAQDAIRSRASGWEPATGIIHWLMWITGATDELVYPGR